MNQVNSILAWATLVHVVFKCDEWADTTKYNVIYEHHRVTNNCHCDNLLGAWNAQHSTCMIHNSKMRINHESMQIKHHIVTINKTHSIKLTKINPTHIRIIINTKTQQQIKNPRNQGNRHEILRENKKTHTFSWRLKLRRWWKWWIFEWNTASMWKRRTNKTMNSKKCSRENWKVLKIVLKAQNTHFSWLTQVVNKLPN